MIQQSLIVNGVTLDMSSDAISLTFRSNITGAIKDITSSSSLTIKLPVTPVNDFVFNFANLPCMPRSRAWLPAVYMRDGIQLIKGEVALLSATADEYEVCLRWGVFSQLQALGSGDKTLRDVAVPSAYNARLIEREGDFMDEFQQIMATLTFGNYYYNNAGATYWFPVVSAGYLLTLILASAGVNVSGVRLQDAMSYYITYSDDLVEALAEKYNIQEPEDGWGADTHYLPPVGGYTFKINEFLPELSQLEFVQGICYIMGWRLEDINGVVTLTDYTLDKSQAVDWSDKMLSEGYAPESLEYNINDMAQRNWMRWKKDDNVSVDADYYVNIDDTTLDEKKDLFVLPFGATAGGNLIKQYNVEYELEMIIVDDNGNEIENPTDEDILNGNARLIPHMSGQTFVKTEPRILGVVDDGPFNSDGAPIPELKFTDDLYFTNIINERYQGWLDLFESPTVITARFNLSIADFININYKKPVYIQQYGCYFAIVELQLEGEVTTAKLLKLK